VKRKLQGYGLNGMDADILLVELMHANFLNEERFAMAYARGKFKIKGWGKAKIKQGLKREGVGEKLIQQALASLGMDDYLDTFGSQAQVGKQIGGDIIQNKKTFLILKALAIGNEDQKQDLLDLFNTENDLLPQEKVKKVTAILTELNIPDEAKRRKQYYFEKGMKSLEEVQVMAAKKELLRKVAFQLLEREN
jgi:hypothetical protein